MMDMDVQDLLRFVKTKGNQRKLKLFEVAKFQTEDEKRSNQLLQDMRQNAEAQTSKQSAFNHQVNDYATQLSEINEKIQNYQHQIQKHVGAKNMIDGEKHTHVNQCK